MIEQLIKQKCIENGDFTLSSGVHSNIYVDIKCLFFNKNDLQVLINATVNAIKTISNAIEINSIGGIEFGAVPLVIGTSLHEDINLDSFIIRKENRSHGTQKRIEGLPKNNILLIEDVITTGKSVIQSIELLKENNYKVTDVLTIVKRQDVILPDNINLHHIVDINRL